MSQKIIWIWKRIVVKPFLENQKETNFWIVLAKKEWWWMPQRWEILSFWDDAKKFWLEIWDEIIFREFSPTKINLNWEDFLLLDVDDVLGKIEKK